MELEPELIEAEVRTSLRFSIPDGIFLKDIFLIMHASLVEKSLKNYDFQLQRWSYVGRI